MRRQALDTGEIIAGKYQVKELLGRGGMGQVYLARHTVTGKRVAIKMLSAGASASDQADKRLLREAVATGCIEHRHVVNVFDVGEHRGALFLVMEYLEGKTFKQLMNERVYSDRALLEILLRAMEGVRAAHAAGVIHRDLKPDNILVCQGPSGQYDDPKVVDFGICRISAESGVTDLTQVGVTMGSPFYMSLEQLQGVRDLDGRADLYALGVILYQALTLRRPFEAATLGELTSKIASGTPPISLSELRPDLPRGLSKAVMRALSRTRDKRQPDVAALIQDLTPYVQQLSLTVSSASARPLLSSATQAAATPMPLWQSERVQLARPWLQLGAAALAAFVLTLGSISLLRYLRDSSEPVAQPIQLGESAPAAAMAPTAPAPSLSAELASPMAEEPRVLMAEEARVEPSAAPAPAPAVLDAPTNEPDQAAPARRPARKRFARAAKPVRGVPVVASPAPSPGSVMSLRPAPPIDTSDPYR